MLYPNITILNFWFDLLLLYLNNYETYKKFLLTNNLSNNIFILLIYFFIILIDMIYNFFVNLLKKIYDLLKFEYRRINDKKIYYCFLILNFFQFRFLIIEKNDLIKFFTVILSQISSIFIFRIILINNYYYNVGFSLWIYIKSIILILFGIQKYLVLSLIFTFLISYSFPTCFCQTIIFNDFYSVYFKQVFLIIIYIPLLFFQQNNIQNFYLILSLIFYYMSIKKDKFYFFIFGYLSEIIYINHR